MRKFWKNFCIAVVLCGSGVLGSFSWAGTVNAVQGADPEGTNVVELGDGLSDERLGWQTGRQDTSIDQLNMQVVDVKSNAQLGSNTLSAIGSTITNGANSIGESAFANASGMMTVIQNSGNQVLIQNDMVLNLFMK